jgi:hypothetical protein
MCQLAEVPPNVTWTVPDDSNTIRHRPPEMPIMIDGSEEDPRAIMELDGQPLHYVVDRQALDGELLHIFTEREAAEQHMADTIVEALPPALRNRELIKGPRPPGEGAPQFSALHANTQFLDYNPLLAGAFPPAGIPLGAGFVDLYEHAEMGGWEWRLSEWQGPYNLPDTWSGGLFGTTLGGRNADRVASSLDAWISGPKPVVILADQPWMRGSWKWLPGRGYIPHLSAIGWNDRARSIGWLWVP